MLVFSNSPARPATRHNSVDLPEPLRPTIRGLHSFTFQLNVSAFWGLGGAHRGSSGDV